MPSGQFVTHNLKPTIWNPRCIFKTFFPAQIYLEICQWPNVCESFQKLQPPLAFWIGISQARRNLPPRPAITLFSCQQLPGCGSLGGSAWNEVGASPSSQATKKTKFPQCHLTIFGRFWSSFECTSFLHAHWISPQFSNESINHINCFRCVLFWGLLFVWAIVVGESPHS